jgi:hypothetical protein
LSRSKPASSSKFVLHIGNEGRREVAPGYADDGEVLGQQASLIEVVERRQQLPFGEIAGCAEDNNDAGFGGAFAPLGCVQLGRCRGHAVAPLLFLLFRSAVKHPG